MDNYTIDLDEDVQATAETMLNVTGEIAPAPRAGVTAFAGMVACFE
jgi:hypothetical protein